MKEKLTKAMNWIKEHKTLIAGISISAIAGASLVAIGITEKKDQEVFDSVTMNKLVNDIDEISSDCDGYVPVIGKDIANLCSTDIIHTGDDKYMKVKGILAFGKRIDEDE